MANSLHFSDAELCCHHCGVNGTEQTLVDVLERIRAAVSAVRGVDTPVHVHDAYRCLVHNSALPNAAKNSQHCLGLAADISVDGMTAAQLAKIAAVQSGVNGIGRNDYAGWIHVDARLSGGPARWCYSRSGATIPWTDAPPAAV